MAKIISQRMTVDTQEDFVIFLIGMRINHLWKVHKWVPVASAMTKMLNELYQNPELGLISHEQWFGRTSIMIQYWKSFEQLESYAKNKSSKHLPAWTAFNKKINSNGDVGIWHETYLSQPGSYECIYNNMPRFGLAKAMDSVPATGRHQNASDRIKRNKK